MADIDILLSRLGEIEAKIDAIHVDSSNTKPLSSGEAAEYLGVSIHWLRRLCSSRSIPYFRTGGGKLISFKREDLDAFLTSRRITPKSEITASAATKIVVPRPSRKRATNSPN